MPKHVLDRRAMPDGSRAERFAEIARKTGPDGAHAAVKEVLKRPKARSDAARLTQFTRIERGEEA